MDTLGKAPTTILDPTYGCLLVGVIIAAMFQGMLMIQAYSYFENFPNDRMRNKIAVGIVCVLDTIQLVLISMATYSNLVTNWGYIPSLAFAPVELNLHLIFTALSCFVAQLFFIERIWRFSRKNIWITASLLILTLAPVVLEFHITTMIVRDTSVKEYARNKDETMAIFVSTAVADISLAVVMCYYLQKERSAFATTRSIVSKALQLVVGSGLATSMIAIGGLILYVLIPHSFYFIALHFQLGRTYTNALLLTLNARHQMRHMASEPYLSNRLGVAINSKPHDVEGIVCIVQLQTETDHGFDSKPMGRKQAENDNNDIFSYA